MLTSKQIRELIAKGEAVRLECKKATGGLPSSLWSSYCAFANSDGGVILLGVEEGSAGLEIVGVEDSARLIRDFWNSVNNPDCVSWSMLFDRYVYAVDCGGKSVVVIEVPRAPREARPVCTGKNPFEGTFRRTGEGDYRCTRESVEAMIRDRANETADSCLLDELTMDVLNADTLSRYRHRFDNLRPEHVWTGLPVDEFLVKIGAAKFGRDGKVHPTVAGLICFGDYVTITDVLPGYFLDYRERTNGEERWSDRVCAQDSTWSGNIYDFFFRVQDRITTDVKVPFTLTADGLTRIDNTAVHTALREALANALIHADYHGRRGVVIEKAGRKISFTNPGTLLMSKEQAISGGISEVRNGRIFNIFALVDIGERSGMGLSNIVGTWKKFGFVAPYLSESVDPESVSLVLEIGSSVESSVESGASSVESSVESGASSVEILNLLNANPQITLSEVAIRLKLTTRAVEKAVGKLKADGKVKRIGPKKGGHWVVSSSGAKAFPSPIRYEGKPLTDEEIDAAKKLGRR